jgi:GT2 family glycosyltransferase
MSENYIAKSPEVSVIVATKEDRLEYLKKCLISLKEQEFRNFEVIVVSKRYPDILSNFFESERIIFIKEIGTTLGAARNQGVKSANGKLVTFLDDDAEAPSDWLKKILLKFDESPALSCLGGPHIGFTKESQNSTLKTACSMAFEAHLQKKYVGKSAIGKIAGCNVTYKRIVFEEIGYINENLRTCEDWDFQTRLAEKGYSLVFDPEISVMHHRGGLRHIFKGSSKSAPFYLSWKTLKLSRYESIFASFYLTNAAFFIIIIAFFFYPIFSLLTFVLVLCGYTIFTAIRTKTYNKKIFYFPIAILYTFARLIGFYYGLIKTLSQKLRRDKTSTA